MRSVIKTMIIEASGASYTGNVRGHNEDNIYVDGAFREDLSADIVMLKSERESETHTYAVFDGMGGEACGERASLIAAKMLYEEEKANPNEDLDIDTYISKTNRHILKESAALDVHSMGTTAAVLFINGDTANAYNVGDSRIYLFRDGELKQLSKDHSVVQSMIDLGFIEEKDRHTNAHAGELIQYIGMSSEEDVEPEAEHKTIQLRKKDIIILCSDGLNSDISDREICDILEKYSDVQTDKLVAEMIMTAKDRVCSDNVSVVIVKCK